MRCSNFKIPVKVYREVNYKVTIKVEYKLDYYTVTTKYPCTRTTATE